MNKETREEATGKDKGDKQPAVPPDEVVDLASALLKVANCLIMCAPQFPVGSEGANAVAQARRSIPYTIDIIKASKIMKGSSNK